MTRASARTSRSSSACAKPPRSASTASRRATRCPTEPAALKAALAPHGLAFVSGWHSLNLLARSVEDEKRAIQPHLDLLKAMGCQVFIACETSNAIHGHDSRPLVDGPELVGAEAWAKFGADVEAIAAFTAAQGLTLVYHHHMGTIVEAPHEIDHFMADDRPGDKAPARHRPLPLRRRDPTELARKYMPRVAHIHAKNVRLRHRRPSGDRAPVLPRRRPPRRLHRAGRPRGRGGLRARPRNRREHGYSGWLVIEAEQDPAVRSPLLYQGMGLTALKAMARAAGLDQVSIASPPSYRRPRQGARHHPRDRRLALRRLRPLPPRRRARPWPSRPASTEVILVLVEGKARIGAGGTDFGELGDRMDVFEAHAAALRLRPRRLRLVGDRDHRLHARGLHRARARPGRAGAVIGPARHRARDPRQGRQHPPHLPDRHGGARRRRQPARHRGLHARRATGRPTRRTGTTRTTSRG